MARKTYTDAQKAEILKKAEETSIAEASKEYGVAWKTISAWKASADVTAEKIETKKTVRSSARKAKAKVAEKKEAAAQKKAEKKEVKDAVAAEVKDAKTAAEIETKKKTRAAGRKVKDAVTAAAEKVDNKILADQMAVGRAKATRTRKASEKSTAKAEKAAVKAEDKAEKAAKKPTVKRKARKMNILFQSVSGRATSSEQIALKVPKEAIDVYVKLEENKIYWVGKNGEKGSTDIW